MSEPITARGFHGGLQRMLPAPVCKEWSGASEEKKKRTKSIKTVFVYPKVRFISAGDTAETNK